jgi:hypothetical protein
MECAPGHEFQVDFGQAAWVVENGDRRKTHLFRSVLSHSRKECSEAVWRQTAESFIRCLESAFRHFGGVAATVIPDLKAGAIQSRSLHAQKGGIRSVPLRGAEGRNVVLLRRGFETVSRGAFGRSRVPRRLRPAAAVLDSVHPNGQA